MYPFSEYKNYRFFDYSCTIPHKYHTFFFGDGGDVFLLGKSQGPVLPSWKYIIISENCISVNAVSMLARENYRCFTTVETGGCAGINRS